MTSVVMHQYAEVESPTFDIKKMSMSIEMDSDRGTNSQEECCHSHVSYCVGQTDLKGEVRRCVSAIGFYAYDTTCNALEWGVGIFIVQILWVMGYWMLG